MGIGMLGSEFFQPLTATEIDQSYQNIAQLFVLFSVNGINFSRFEADFKAFSQDFNSREIIQFFSGNCYERVNQQFALLPKTIKEQTKRDLDYGLNDLDAHRDLSFMHAQLKQLMSVCKSVDLGFMTLMFSQNSLCQKHKLPEQIQLMNNQKNQEKKVLKRRRINK